MYRALVGAALGRVALHGVHGYAVAYRRRNTHNLSRDGLFSVLCSELATSLQLHSPSRPVLVGVWLGLLLLDLFV